MSFLFCGVSMSLFFLTIDLNFTNVLTRGKLGPCTIPEMHDRFSVSDIKVNTCRPKVKKMEDCH